MRHTAWLNVVPKEQEKPRRETVSAAQQELVTLDEYEQHIIKLWREVGSVSQGGMGVAPLVWEEIIKWADRFYLMDKVIYVPKKTTKMIEKTIRGKPAIQTETIIEEIPIVVKESSVEDYELEIIMQLSREYCDEYHSATDPMHPCPREFFLDEIDAESNADAILEGFKSQWGGVQDRSPEVVRN